MPSGVVKKFFEDARWGAQRYRGRRISRAWTAASRGFHGEGGDNPGSTMLHKLCVKSHKDPPMRWLCPTAPPAPRCSVSAEPTMPCALTSLARSGLARRDDAALVVAVQRLCHVSCPSAEAERSARTSAMALDTGQRLRLLGKKCCTPAAGTAWPLLTSHRAWRWDSAHVEPAWHCPPVTCPRVFSGW